MNDNNQTDIFEMPNNNVNPQVQPDIIFDNSEVKSDDGIDIVDIPTEKLEDKPLFTAPNQNTVSSDIPAMEDNSLEVKEAAPEVTSEPEVYNTLSPVIEQAGVIENPVVEQAVEGSPEMPFAGVNQNNMTIAEQTIIEDSSVSNDIMKPVEEVQDENAGLKFLLVIGIILIVAVILLPAFL